MLSFFLGTLPVTCIAEQKLTYHHPLRFFYRATDDMGTREICSRKNLFHDVQRHKCETGKRVRGLDGREFPEQQKGLGAVGCRSHQRWRVGAGRTPCPPDSLPAMVTVQTGPS